MSNPSASTPNPWHTPPPNPQAQKTQKTPTNPQTSVPYVYAQVFRLLRDNAANWIAIYTGVLAAMLLAVLPFFYFAFRDLIDMILFPDAAYERMLENFDVSAEAMIGRLLFGYLLLTIAIAASGALAEALLLRGALSEIDGHRATFGGIWAFDHRVKNGFIGFLAYLGLLTVTYYLHLALSMFIGFRFPDFFVLISLLFFALLIAGGLALHFIPHFMSDQGMGVGDAVRASLRITQDNLGAYVLLALPLLGVGGVALLLLNEVSGPVTSLLLFSLLWIPLMAVANFVTAYFYRQSTGRQPTHRA